MKLIVYCFCMGCVENINSYAPLRPKSANVGLGFLLKFILIVRGGRLRESSLQNIDGFDV